MGPSSVTNLRIWHEGMSIVKDSYSLSRAWPKSELFGLTSQVRRAAVSIPCNLAEGRGRGTGAEMARFAHIALGSLYELDSDRLSSLSRQISKYIQDRKPSG